MLVLLLFVTAFLQTGVVIGQDILPSQILSRNKKAYTSSGRTDNLTDNQFNNSSWTASNDSWIALYIGSGPQKVFFSWNDPSYSWSDQIAAANSCKNSIRLLVDYKIQTSSNSSNGSNGDWSTVETITGNSVTARGHAVDFSGAAWIRLLIEEGSGSIDEIEVFDISQNEDDIWFFVGTSISANTYKGTPPPINFAEHIHVGHTAYAPAMIRGGIPCILSRNMSDDIDDYLAASAGAKYWAIEMGTNDAWGGSSGNVSTFKSNLQSIITSCQNAGIEPIIARVLSTNETAAGWQVHPDFLTAVDDLTTTNNLIAGPDLYTWFIENPQGLSDDGVHPNAQGAREIQRLWAEAMLPLYGEADSTEVIYEEILSVQPENSSSIFKIYPNPVSNYLDVSIDTSWKSDQVVVKIIDMDGKEVVSQKIENESFVKFNLRTLKNAVYFVKVTNVSIGQSTTQKVVLKSE